MGAKRDKHTVLDSEDLLAEGFERLSEGIGLFDSDLTLRHCNGHFRALRNYPTALCQPGTPLHALLRYNAERGDFGPGDPDVLVAERIAEIKAAPSRIVEREMADGLILRIQYQWLASGGLMLVMGPLCASSPESSKGGPTKPRPTKEPWVSGKVQAHDTFDATHIPAVAEAGLVAVGLLLFRSAHWAISPRSTIKSQCPLII